MEFTRATSEQVDAIVNVVVQCRDDLAARDILQWDDQYPTRAFFDESLAADQLFVLTESEEVVGVVVLNEAQAPEWRPVVWQDSKGHALIVHSLAVLPSSQGRGYGKAILNFCEAFAREQGYTSIRLDAFSENTAAVRFYERHGYILQAEIQLLNKPVGHQCYYCYEKCLPLSACQPEV
ncbi:MAG: hypothetical protein JWN14_4400 [Chthonomonadales bacterium]|nr:hypothetical protein [Chthonomonadales bacterium]